METSRIRQALSLHRAWLCGRPGRRADLQDADMSGMSMPNLDAQDAILRGVDLTGADLYRAILSGADLRGAVLVGAHMRWADLTGACLRRAILSGADLRGANLTGADLTGACLTGADITEADLTDADLTGALGAPPYASVGWSGHGERGRRLSVVRHDGRTIYHCGCWSGDADQLQAYIDDGDPELAPSRRRAMWLVSELVGE